MKNSILSLFFLVGSHYVSTSQIIWDSIKKISWKDFAGESDSVQSFTAYTSTKMEIDYQVSDSFIEYEVNSVFIKGKSWTLDTSEYLLNHERIHFDITELYSRKIRRYFNTIDVKLMPEDEIEKTINLLIKDKARYETLYDTETNHSINIQKQQKWEIKVKAQLNSMQQYAICSKRVYFAISHIK